MTTRNGATAKMVGKRITRAGNAGGSTRRIRRARAPFAVLSLVVTIVLGILCGVGAFTFGYGKGWSYLSHDPAACANCHVMQDHYYSWQNSSHRHVAVCNDCHLPHDFVGKWMVKGENGFFHSLAFTLENFHEPIQIKPRNKRVAQGACLSCHAELVHQMLPADPQGEVPTCVHCHRDVGHAFR
jgi:cytochrome c nitrite reductase small subunit